jgi:hypothetical protein
VKITLDEQACRDVDDLKATAFEDFCRLMEEFDTLENPRQLRLGDDGFFTTLKVMIWYHSDPDEIVITGVRPRGSSFELEEEGLSSKTRFA